VDAATSLAVRSSTTIPATGSWRRPSSPNCGKPAARINRRNSPIFRESERSADRARRRECEIFI